LLFYSFISQLSRDRELRRELLRDSVAFDVLVFLIETLLTKEVDDLINSIKHKEHA